MKKIFVMIMVLSSIAFLTACGNNAQKNTAADPVSGGKDTTATVQADTGAASITATKPKLPKMPADAQAEYQGNTTAANIPADDNEKKVESDVKSILSDIQKEENLNNDSGTAPTDNTGATK